METRDWLDLNPDPAHVKRERAKARELRATDWWRAQLAKGVCHYCGRLGSDARYGLQCGGLPKCH